MVNLKVLMLLCAVIISVCGSEITGAVDIDPQPPISPNSTTTSTEKPTTVTTSTTKPTTVTTSTTAPTTVTTSTAKPTTVTTSTTAPTTVTTSTTKPTPVPPTPKPTPTPDPTVANWTVKYENSNSSCIYIEVAMQYVINVPNTNQTVTVNVPADANATGSCEDKNKQNMKLTWGQNNSLELDFGKSNTSKFDIDDLSTTLVVTLESGGSKVYNFTHKSPEFSTPLSNSYKCARVQKLNLTEESTNTTFAALHVSHLQFQAFKNTTETKFDTALDCEGTSTSDVVPIVVGCVLAVLVIMVLVAYLVGRRRCQARGYLSM